MRLLAARHYQDRSAPVRRIATSGQGRLRRALRPALRALGDRLDAERATVVGRDGRWREVADAIDWAHWGEIVRGALAVAAGVHAGAAAVGARKISAAFAARGRVVRYRKGEADQPFAKDADSFFRYDGLWPATAARIRATQDLLIAELGRDARDTIAEVIERGLLNALTVEEIIGDIRATIGLTSRQATAVLNYRAMLQSLDSRALKRQLTSLADDARLAAAIDAGTPLEQAVIDEMVGRYGAAMLSHRAATIARTEAVRAANAGLNDAYTQAVERGVFPAAAVTRNWQVDLDERTCAVCRSIPEMNPDGVALGEAFQSSDGPVHLPPLHVSCRCGVEIVTNLDMLPAEGSALAA